VAVHAELVPFYDPVPGVSNGCTGKGSDVKTATLLHLRHDQRDWGRDPAILTA